MEYMFLLWAILGFLLGWFLGYYHKVRQLFDLVNDTRNKAIKETLTAVQYQLSEKNKE